MKQGQYSIGANREIAGNVFQLVLRGDTSAFTAPGQFLNIKLPGYFLRRPISVCDWDEDSVTVLYKIAGEGTKALSRLEPGFELDVLTGLGNGFDLSAAGPRPLVVGGGIGAAPMYRLMKDLTAQGKHPTAVLGFNSRADIFYADEFRALPAEVIVATADGSCGVKGFVTDGVASVKEPYSFVYACGPTVMLKALEKVIRGPAEYSFEERMGCGFGACMGCTCETKNGNRRVCRDGPVFRREEILW